MLKTRVSRPFFEQICSKPAFPGLPCTWNARNPLWNSIFWLGGPSFCRNRAWMLKMRVSRPFLLQIRSEPAFPGLPRSLEKLQALFGSTSVGFRGTQAQSCSEAALPGAGPLVCPGHPPGQGIAHRRPAQVEPWTSGMSTGNKHKSNRWPHSGPGNHALTASTGGTFGLVARKHWAARTGQTAGRMAVKRRQPATTELMVTKCRL